MALAPPVATARMFQDSYNVACLVGAGTTPLATGVTVSTVGGLYPRFNMACVAARLRAAAAKKAELAGRGAAGKGSWDGGGAMSAGLRGAS